MESLYEAPLVMEQEHLAQAACECLHLSCPEPELSDWTDMAKLPAHPWFLATQAHTELKSRPNRTHPLFQGFIEAAIHCKRERQSNENRI